MRSESRDAHRIVNPQSLGAKAGAAFGATLYRDLVLLGASECQVDNESNSFILLSSFGSVQASATWCFEIGKRT
jgi:hypothetical protein